MKGILGTADLMRAVFNKEHGLRTGPPDHPLHVLRNPGPGPMVILTDGGVNTFPDLEKKADILEKCRHVLPGPGVRDHQRPPGITGAGGEPKIQSRDADALAHMTDRWAKYP